MASTGAQLSPPLAGADGEDVRLLSTQKEHIEKIWGRARANAFAHRDAAELFSTYALVLFLFQCAAGLTSLFLVVALYAIISRDPWITSGWTPLFLTLASLLYSIIGLALSVVQNYVRFEERAANHRHNHHSFLYLAQRSREIDSPGIDEPRGQALIDDLERDFQILKVRGQEPNDRNFRVGHTFLQGIGESQFARLQTSHLQAIKDGGTEPPMQSPPSEKGDDVLLNRVRRNETSWPERNVKPITWAVAMSLYVASVVVLVTKVWSIYDSDANAHYSKLRNQTILAPAEPAEIQKE